jgi:hypothetical protein
MKKLKFTILSLTSIVFVNCTDEVTDIPNVLPPNTLFEENFNTVTNNTDLDLAGWINFAEVGTVKWRENVFSGNGYAQVNAFNSLNPNSVAWLLTPELDAGDNASQEKRISFKLSKFFLDLDSPDNTIKVYYTNNFNQSNLASVTWESLEANIPKKSGSNYAFEGSNIELKNKTGKFRIAFRYNGNGLANSLLDGGFQLDDFKFFTYN